MEEVKKSGKTSGGDASPKECGRTAWTEYLFSAIENRDVREHQHVDGRSTAEPYQDCGTLAAIDAFSDPTIVSDANAGRGLKTVIPLSRTVNYCAVGRTTRPMTYARAMASEKRGGEVVSIADNTIPLGVSLICPTSFFIFFCSDVRLLRGRGPLIQWHKYDLSWQAQSY